MNTSTWVGGADGIGKHPELQPWQEGYAQEKSGRNSGRRFIVFEAAEENEQDRGMQTRRMASISLFSQDRKLMFWCGMNRTRCHILCN